MKKTITSLILISTFLTGFADSTTYYSDGSYAITSQDSNGDSTTRFSDGTYANKWQDSNGDSTTYYSDGSYSSTMQ